MGTLNFTVGSYARTRGNGPATLISTSLRTSGSHTTSTTAANVQVSAQDVSLSAGDVFRAVIDEPAWVRFSGNTAAVGTGFYMRADIEYEWECESPGAISVIDVS